MESINPFNLELIRSHKELNSQEISDKVKASYDSFLVFRDSSLEERSEKFIKLAKILKKNADEYGKTITMEMGKPIVESIAEINKCAWVCEFYAENATSFLKDKIIETDADISWVSYQALGPVLAVMPWNFPFWQVFRFATPALMAGNTALLKHASNVQICGNLIEKLFLKAGFEKNVFQNLMVPSHRVESLIDNPLVKAVTLTGSEAAGSAVASRAGRNIKKTVLELGGNNAFVVLKDANLELAVETAITARLLNGGQSCIAAKRFLIEDDIYDEFLQLLIKNLSSYLADDPLKRTTRLGPLSSSSQSDEIRNQIDRSVESGAVVLHKGRSTGNLFDPVILVNVKPGMPAFDEELFGPVFAVSKVKKHLNCRIIQNLALE